MPYHYFGGYLMNTYTIYLGAHPIACVCGHDAAYACYEAARTIAEYTNRTAYLVWDETGELVAGYGPEEEDESEPSFTCEDMNCGYWWQDADEDYPRCHFEGDVAPCEEDDYYEDDDLECGFDPYCGCYTDDC